MLGRCLHPVVLATFIVVAAGGCSAGDDAADSSSDAVTSVPPSTVRDQKETGNCWLYATTAWLESVERAAAGAGDASDAPAAGGAFSVTYLDYWDWFAKITGGKIEGKTSDALDDDLDSGGSFGSAVELIQRYGVVRARDFGGDGAMKDATAEGAASKTIAASLLHGALAKPAARKDASLVRRELDRAFAVSAAVSAEMTATFGADGAKTFQSGATSRTGMISSPDAIEVLAPHPDGTSEVVTLTQAIGERAAPGSDPDQRTGPYAWNDVVFKAGDAGSTRRFFQRIQRALNAGVPLPFGWFYASNADPNDSGIVRAVPKEPADDDESVGHETVIVDYEVENVPGFGTLRAGEPASPEARAAALDDGARVTFLRLTDSYGTHLVKGRRVNARDLYLDYLLGTVRVCPAGVAKTSPKCRDEIPLEDVTLPAGF